MKIESMLAPSVEIMLSAQADGSMSKAVDDVTQRSNRRQFLERHGLTLEDTILVHLKYKGDDYCRYFEVGFEQRGDGMAFDSSIVADALFTRTRNIAFFLPVADCIGAVLHDARQGVLGLAHLGRHNLVQSGGTKLIEYLRTEFQSAPDDIRVWLSPAAGRASYPLHDFNNRSLHEMAIAQLEAGGLRSDAIEVDNRDTTSDRTFFSHSEFLKGNRQSDGRQAIVARMHP